MISKYIYQHCEHHQGCDWEKPANEEPNSNRDYIRHICDRIASKFALEGDVT